MARTHSEDRNHLSFPRRSDSAAMASKYRHSTAAPDTRIPKTGRRDPNPENGAGGGLSIVSRDLAILASGDINDRSDLDLGWDSDCQKLIRRIANCEDDANTLTSAA
jgi:hypothetical protein